MLRSLRHATWKTVFTVAMAVAALGTVAHSTEKVCSLCDCSGSSLSDDWHYAVCRWEGDCSLHLNTDCDNVG